MILFCIAIMIIVLSVSLLVYAFSVDSPEIAGISDCCTIASFIFSIPVAITESQHFLDWPAVLPIATGVYILLHISDVKIHMSALLSDAKEKILIERGIK